MTLVMTAAECVLNAPRPTSRHPLIRVTWLRHRTALAGFSVAFAALACAMIAGRSEVQGIYASYINAGCATGKFNATCANASNAFANHEDLFTAVTVALRVLPVAIGVFLGAPLLARELESGSFRFSWTQAVGRRRQVVTTFAVLAGFLVAASAGLGLLYGWFSHPFEVAHTQSQWDSGLFESTPLVLAGWTTFAFTLGTLLGAVIGRTVAAMAATAITLGALAIGTTFEFVQRLLSIAPAVVSHIAPTTNFGMLNQASYPGYGLPGTWLVRAWVTGPHGVLLTHSALLSLERPMYYPKDGKPDPAKWLSEHHYVYSLAYQPASRFWIFQGVETAILFGLATVLVAGTLWRVRRV
jgi:hypothetical protein